MADNRKKQKENNDMKIVGFYALAAPKGMSL